MLEWSLILHLQNYSQPTCNPLHYMYVETSWGRQVSLSQALPHTYRQEYYNILLILQTCIKLTDKHNTVASIYVVASQPHSQWQIYLVPKTHNKERAQSATVRVVHVYINYVHSHLKQQLRTLATSRYHSICVHWVNPTLFVNSSCDILLLLLQVHTHHYSAV